MGYGESDDDAGLKQSFWRLGDFVAVAIGAIALLAGLVP